MDEHKLGIEKLLFAVYLDPFACLVSRTFSVSQQCFSLTINQRTVLSSHTSIIGKYVQ
jgi:hypothetical protein